MSIDLAIVAITLVSAMPSNKFYTRITGGTDKMDLTVTAIKILTTSGECETYPCSVKRGTNATVFISFKDVGMCLLSVHNTMNVCMCFAVYYACSKAFNVYNNSYRASSPFF